MSARFYSYYEELIDKTKPLMPQLYKFKKSCFKPYIKNEQLIKYCCENCANEKKYSNCEFYEVTHTLPFKEILNNILDNKSIKPPLKAHPYVERLCINKLSLEKLLDLTWELENKYSKRLENEYPCTHCNMKDDCNFYINNIASCLLVMDITEYGEDKVYFNHHEPIKITAEGFRTKSYYYKNIILNREKTLKEISTIKDLKNKKIFEDIQYELYDKIFTNKKDLFNNFIISNLHLFLILRKNKKLINFFFLLQEMLCNKNKSYNITINNIISYINDNYTELNMSDVKHIKKIENNIEELVKMKLLCRRNNDNAIYQYSNTSFFINRNYKEFIDEKDINIILENIHKLKFVTINFNLLFEYKNTKKISYSDIVYEYFLSENDIILRAKIEDIFNIPKNVQIEIEKKLNIKKVFIFKNEEDIVKVNEKIKMINKQLPNIYMPNRFVINNIFTIDENINKIILEKIKNKND